MPSAHPVAPLSPPLTRRNDNQTARRPTRRSARTRRLLIPGGMVPGVTIIQPDYPELKESWPFLWYENEYVVDAATTLILAANAADALAH
jgi:hypothetical protein